QSKLVKYFSRQLSCKRKVALQERNAKLEGFPQLLHWFRIVDIRKEVMEEIAPGQLSLEDLLDMTDEQVCATLQKFGANSEECARLNASLSCLRSVHKSGGSLSKQDWTIQWPSTEPGKENSPGCPPEPGPWARTHLSPKIQPKCGQHHCHASSSHGPAYTHVDRLTVEGHPGLCPPLESGHRSLPPSPRQRHTPPRTPNIVTTVTPPGTPPVRRRNKLKPPGTPPPSSRKLIHLLPGFTALHRSKSHEFQLGHRVDEAHTPKASRQRRRVPVTSAARGCHSARRWLSQPPVTAGSGWQGSSAVSPVRDTPEVAVTHRPRGFALPGSPAGTADPIKRGCRFWDEPSPDLCWGGQGKHGGGMLVQQPRVSCHHKDWDTFHCPRLLQAPSSLALDTPRDAGTPSTVPGCSQPHPAWPWALPGMQGQSQLNLPPREPFHPRIPPIPALWQREEEVVPPYPVPPSLSAPSHSFLCVPCQAQVPQQMHQRGAAVSPADHPPRRSWISGGFPPVSSLFYCSPRPFPPAQNEEGAEEVQESEDDFEEMNLSLLSARNFPRKASQTSIFLQEWDIPFEQLEVGELIGKGRFGQVFHGRWHGEVAIRLIDIERDNEDQLKAFKREVMAYRQTRHENVVLFMGACMSPPHLAIITSLCKGRTLYSVVRDAKIVLDVNKTRQIAQEIVKGMGYLHAKGILHKDLKSKNVFYDNGKVVITDFGLFSISGVLQAGRRENKLRIQNGWLCHLAPEIIRQLSPDTEEDKLPFSKHSDVFALGTIWYELHAREWPFKTQPAEAIIWQVGRGMKPNLSQIGMGKEISDILLFCWAYEQEERPTFTKLMDMLEKLPKRNRRLSHPGHFWKSAE
ncbi:KSR2 Kinase, partial [Urocynchramus pylzowi]|nr:KSR2 Kinase [Urocynchramus pylzowi]